MFTLKKVQRACCGRSTSIKPTRTDAFAKSSIATPGAVAGTTLVIYSGNRVGAFSIWGFSTGTMYRVKPGVPFAVHDADMYSSDPKKHPGVMDRYNDDNTFMFNLYQEPAKTVVKSVTEDVPEKEEETAVLEEEVKTDVSILDGNVLQVTTALENNTYTNEELVALLAHEQLNKNRVTVTRLLEEKING